MDRRQRSTDDRGRLVPASPTTRGPEDGATSIEYGLVAALIVIAFLAAATVLGLRVETLYLYVVDAVGAVVDFLT